MCVLVCVCVVNRSMAKCSVNRKAETIISRLACARTHVLVQHKRHKHTLTQTHKPTDSHLIITVIALTSASKLKWLSLCLFDSGNTKKKTHYVLFSCREQKKNGKHCHNVTFLRLDSVIIFKASSPLAYIDSSHFFLN